MSVVYCQHKSCRPVRARWQVIRVSCNSRAGAYCATHMPRNTQCARCLLCGKVMIHRDPDQECKCDG